MRDFLRYIRLTYCIVISDEAWFIVVPAAILIIAVMWTISVTVGGNWDAAVGVSYAEILGGLTAAFLCAPVLDTEKRRGAGEIVFSKPHSPAALLAVRIGMMLGLTLALVAAMLLALQVALGDAMIGYALLCALPSCLFMGMVALTASQYARHSLSGMAVPLLVWFWTSTLGAAYNPLFLLEGGYAGLDSGSVPFNVLWNKVALLAAAAVLFRFNVRLVRRSGAAVGGERSRRTAVRVLRVSAVAAGLVIAYLWSGAVVLLYQISRGESHTRSMPYEQLDTRPFGGQPASWAGQSYAEFNMFHSAMPLRPFLGAQAAAALRGVGVGLSQAERDVAEPRRASLLKAIDLDTASDWAALARLELAAMDYLPAPAHSMSYGPGAAVRAVDEPQWFTVALIDADRWFVIRKPAGRDVVGADRMLSEIGQTAGPDRVVGEALLRRAEIAGLLWDLREQHDLLVQAAAQYPASALGDAAVDQLASAARTPEQTAEAITLARLAVRSADELQAATATLKVARMQLQAGEREAASATMSEADRLVKAASTSPRRAVRKRAEDLDREIQTAKRQPSLGGPPQGIPFRLSRRFGPPPARLAGETASGGPCGAHVRVLAAGKPLAGVRIALVPVAEVAQCVMTSGGGSILDARAAGAQDASVPRMANPYSSSGGQSFSTVPIMTALRARTRLATTTAQDGSARWSGLPAGAYAVVVHAGSWQFPNAGRDLAAVPTVGPAVLAGPDVALPDVRFEPTLRVVAQARRLATPSVRWSAAGGAKRYRVTLRDDSGTDLGGMSAAESGSPSGPVAPEVTWWRDGIATTSVAIDAHAFVGPPNVMIRAGLSPVASYRACVEATDAKGRPVATSDALDPGPPLYFLQWRALRDVRRPVDPRMREAAQRRYRARGMFGGMAPGEWYPGSMPPAELESPFLRLIAADHSAETNAAARRKFEDRRRERESGLPGIVFAGRGMPGRKPLATVTAAFSGMPPGFGPGMMMPPAAGPFRARGPMMPGFAGRPPLAASLPIVGPGKGRPATVVALPPGVIAPRAASTLSVEARVRTDGDRAVLQVTNRGASAERIAIRIGGAPDAMEVDLAPGGKALVPMAEATAVAQVQCRGKDVTITR